MFSNINVQSVLSVKNDRNVIIWSVLWLMIKPSSSLGVIFHPTANCSPTEMCLTLADITIFIALVVFGLGLACHQCVNSLCTRVTLLMWHFKNKDTCIIHTLS